MEKEKRKYNKLSIISLILTVLGFSRFILGENYFGGALFVAGFVLAVISISKIIKQKQKGLYFSLFTIVVFILLFIAIITTILFPRYF